MLPAAFGPANAEAQEEVDDTASIEVGAGFQATSIRGDLAWLGGGTLLFRIGDFLQVGGGGWLLLRDHALSRESADGGLKLRMSYGGLVAGGSLVDAGRMRFDVRALVGAGTARIKVRVESADGAKVPVELAERAADNFFVVEPQLGLTMPIDERWRARLTVGYRKAYGVEDVFNVTAGQVSGGSAGVVVVFDGFGQRR